jgi:arylsulfatase A-like enzyme/Tfp pilus assembly protein PilF
VPRLLLRGCCLLLAIAAAAAIAGPVHAVPQRTRPSILLVTLDTTRADRMGFMGSTRGLTPALDAFARNALVFTNAYAQAPITTVSHATILTGTYPPFHHVTDFGAPLATTIPYLPDVLRQAGYRTAAFVGSLVLDPRTGTAPGFDRGFETYDAGFRVRRPGENRYQTVERRGDEVVTRASAWIAQQRTGPWFAWVHLYDAHDPYEPPADLKDRFATARYDGEIAGVDRAISRLLPAIDANTIVAVTADHGEALGDHGEDTHGVFLYEPVMHVPLILRLPGTRTAQVRARVRLADLAPTLIAAAALTPPAAMQGESLLPLAQGNDMRDRPVFAETNYPQQAFNWLPLSSWRADRFLLVRGPKPELYDTTTDAGATQNIAATRARVVQGMSAEQDAFVQRVAGGASPGAKAPIDPDLAARLASLGYVSGAGAPDSHGVDPKDRIATANALHAATMAVEDGAFQRAIPLLEKVTAAEPRIPLAQLQLGVAYARQRQYARAVPTLRQAVALQPENMFGHYELAVGLYETGDLNMAAKEFELVAARMPNWADAQYSLGSVLARIDRVADASRCLRRAIELEPRHFRANLLLGRILTLQGQASAALAFLKTATEIEPRSSEAHSFLADAFEKTGAADEAAKERQRAKSLIKP